MGKNNRQRRKAKMKKRRARSQAGRNRADGLAGPGPHGPGCRCDEDLHAVGGDRPPPNDPVETENLLAALVEQDDGRFDRTKIVDLLLSTDASTVYRVVEAMFARQLSWLWGNHWLPGEVIRQARRSVSASGAALMSAAVAVDHERRDVETMHPRWIDHVAELDLPLMPAKGWYRLFVAEAGLSGVEAITLPTDVMRALDLGIIMDEIIPPPGTGRAVDDRSLADRQPTSDPILEKVRNLLAQAESTNFDAEAEAFTAKAQELMARHSLDEALVWERGDRSGGPVASRIAIDEPYPEAKRLLLHVVAGSLSCRSIFNVEPALSTVVGFEADVRATETLFTSLLLQAQRSLQRAAAAAPPGAHTRSRRFRSSFLTSYAGRIGERLEEINTHVRREAEAGTGADLLPVLASRSMAVDADVERRFGDLTSQSIRVGRDAAGLVAGRMAADRAELARTLVNLDDDGEGVQQPVVDAS